MKKSFYPEALLELINSLSKLPGIGKRTAERLAISLVKWKRDDLAKLSGDILGIADKICKCQSCGSIADEDICGICSDENRQQNILCVVEDITQIAVIEKSGSFQGVYHVLGGHISPLNGILPNDLNISGIDDRVQKNSIDEVILATSPDVEGEATASYIADLLKNHKIKITRIALGVPVGADLTYADSATMAMAIQKRGDFN